MHKKILFIFALLALFVFTSTVLADTDNGPKTGPSMMASTSLGVRASSSMMKASTSMMERGASTTMQEKRIEFQKEIAKRQVDNVARVIRATIKRLEMIIVRIESRIVKVKAAGGGTSISESYVAAAKVSLDNASKAVDAFSQIDLTSDRAKENFEKIRQAAKNAKEYIREAHTNLMMAVRNLKGANANASTTNEVNGSVEP